MITGSKSDLNFFTAAVFPCSEAYLHTAALCSAENAYALLAVLLVVPHVEWLHLLTASRYLQALFLYSLVPRLRTAFRRLHYGKAMGLGIRVVSLPVGKEATDSK